MEDMIRIELAVKGFAIIYHCRN